MTGHRKFNQLIEKLSPERKARVDQKTDELRQEIALLELQQSFMEKQTDMYVNHLQLADLVNAWLYAKTHAEEIEMAIAKNQEI